MAKKYLLLLRHGQAPVSADIDDKERKLNETGISEISSVAKFLNQMITPDKILASDALRTQQTAEELHKRMEKNFNIELTPNLYNCEPTTLVEQIETCDNTVKNLMIVAHNPAITSSLKILKLASNPDLEVKAMNYDPTGKVVVLSSNLESWEQARSATWKIAAVYWPD